MKTETRYLRRGPRVTGCVIVLGAVLACIWWYRIQEMPAITPPIEPMPRPNAYDSLQAAGDVLVDDRKIAFAIAAAHTNSGFNREYSTAEKRAFIKEIEALSLGYARD